MIGQTISHYKSLEKLGEGGMGIVYGTQDFKLNHISSFKLSPKGIEISSEGNALGSDVHNTTTTLKGLNISGTNA